MKALRLVLAAALLFAAPAAQAAYTKGTEYIALVVNDEPITASDVAARTRLILVSSGMPNTADVREKMKPQIVNSLIEERLMMQEARKLQIKISKDDINLGFETVAKQNNIPVEKFRALLAQSNIPARTLEDQIEAQIAWGKVVQKKIRPDVTISDSEIDEALARLRNDIGKQQYLVADIFLAVGAPQDDAKVHALADRLSNEMVRNHIPFSRIAGQFSQSAGASRGGDLGWVQEGQLAAEINRVLVTMKEGELAKPVRTEDGYHIVFLRKKMTVTEQTLPSREGITEKLGMEELDRRQRRYLMDLKAAASIERRA